MIKTYSKSPRTLTASPSLVMNQPKLNELVLTSSKMPKDIPKLMGHKRSLTTNYGYEVGKGLKELEEMIRKMKKKAEKGQGEIEERLLKDLKRSKSAGKTEDLTKKTMPTKQLWELEMSGIKAEGMSKDASMSWSWMIEKEKCN